MVKKYREGKTELASNQITATLGNTLNGPQSINGVDPTQVKQNLQVLGDLSKQAQTSEIGSTEAAVDLTPAVSSPATSVPQNNAPSPNTKDPRAAKEELVNQLLNKPGAANTKYNLSSVPEDQLDYLVNNAAQLSQYQQGI